MSETWRFSTSDFAAFGAEVKKESTVFDLKPDIISVDKFNIGGQYSMARSTSSTKEGELKLGSIVFWGDRGINSQHEYSSVRPLDRSFIDDSYTYKGLILFYSDSKSNNNGAEYGSFHYDGSGLLRTIKGGYFTHDSFDTNAPSAAFQRTEEGLWKVYRFEQFGQPDITQFYKIGEKMQPQQDLMKNGKPYILDEIATTITESDGRLHFHQQTLTGHKQKDIDVPASIDVLTWKQLFHASDGSFINILKYYPSSIRLKI